MAIIRALPQLQKLDNVQVTPEEVKEALRRGRVLAHPEDATESDNEEYGNPQGQYGYSEYAEPEYSPPQRSPQQQVDCFTFF